MMTSKDRYIRNTINKKAISVDYIKKDLSQVNPQLHEWLRTVNDKSSNLKVAQSDNKINMQSKRNSELATNRDLVAGVIKQLAKNDKENKSLNSYVANIDEITKALDRVDEINLLTFGMKLYKKCARYYI
ncbi:MAG: hypothetical protein E7242_04395 [Lachnospiraceae bacterium]|nr:hypothetical protein [Lachnospiraceae bacterium]